MNILLLEDEPLVAVSLVKMVKDIEPEAVLTGPVQTVKAAKEYFHSHPAPDLVLADIQLCDGISLDIFSDESIQCPVIFTTAYNEYAIRAFKLNSIDYLLKPVDKKELAAAFQKFHLLQSKFANMQYLQEMKQLFANFNHPQKYKERFAVHAGRSVTLVPVEDTACFLREELIYLFNHEGKKFITDFRSLDEIEELLDPAAFFRANRQHLLHLPFIESYRSDDTGKVMVKMRGFKMEEIVVSKERAAEWRKWFE